MKKFSKGASSSRSNFQRDQTPAPPRMELLDLPQQLLHSNPLFVACDSFRDVHKAKAVCKTFKNVIEEEVFFKEVDVYFMGDKDWYLPLPQLTEFRLLYLELGNPSASFMRSLWDNFSNGKMEEGLEAIKVAAEKGYNVAIYTYAMIRRIMTPHSASDSPLINNLSRDFYAQTRRKIDEARNGFALAVESPLLFKEKTDRLSTTPIRSCECAPYIETYYSNVYDERVKGGRGTPMCDWCFWIIQSISFS